MILHYGNRGEQYFAYRWWMPNTKYKARIDSVPNIRCEKSSRKSTLPRKRLRKELDELLLPFVRAKRKKSLESLLTAWRWDKELVPSNYGDRNWKQFNKHKKQWMHRLKD